MQGQQQCHTTRTSHLTLFSSRQFPSPVSVLWSFTEHFEGVFLTFFFAPTAVLRWKDFVWSHTGRWEIFSSAWTKQTGTHNRRLVFRVSCVSYLCLYNPPPTNPTTTTQKPTPSHSLTHSLTHHHYHPLYIPQSNHITTVTTKNRKTSLIKRQQQ